MKIAVLGASGNTGLLVVPALVAAGHEVSAISRDPERQPPAGDGVRAMVADLDRPETLAPTLAGAEVVVSLAYGRYFDVVRTHLPPTCRRWVSVGSLRDPTWLLPADAAGLERGRALAAAPATEGTPELVWLDPAMIYGAPKDQTVGRLLGLIARWPRFLPVVVPLPVRTRARLQPVFVDDMVAALVAAVDSPTAPGPAIAVAGPEPLSYAAMVRGCAQSLGRRACVVPVPRRLLAAAVRLAARARLLTPVSADELARMGGDKTTDISALTSRLGVTPRPFAEGVRLKVARG